MSKIAHFVKGSLITPFSITNSKWMTFHILWKAVSSHLLLWPTASEWHCTFGERQSHHIFSYENSKWVTLDIWWKAIHIISCDQQSVSDIAHFVTGSLITSCSMTNSLEWVTLHILWKAISSHLFLWPTASECIGHFMKGSLITSFPMTNRQWVTLHILWKAALSHISPWIKVCEWHCTFLKCSLIKSFPWPTGCKWHCTFYERKSYHIFSYDLNSL